MFRVSLFLLLSIVLLAPVAPAGAQVPMPQRLGQARKIYDHPTLHRTSIAYSPDGKRLAWVHHQIEGGSPEEGGLAVVVWDFDKGYQIVEMRPDKPRTYARSPIRFTPNGRMMVIGCFQPIPTFTPKGDEQTEYRNNVLLWLVLSGRELTILPRVSRLDNDSWEAVMVHPDGKSIVAVCPKLGRVWELPEGKQALQFEHTEANRLVLSPDCKLFAGTLANRTVAVFNAADGKEVLKLPGTGQALGFSPDGKKLATWQEDKVCLWDLEGEGEGEGPKQLWSVRSKEGAESLWGPRVAFTPDGKGMAWNDGRQTVVADPATGKALLTLNGERGPITFSPDGQRLALACPDGTALVWDLGKK
jgi:WD40 repeat protein